MKVVINKKYQDIYGTAKNLFWKYGIKRVSIEEICKESNVSKMTFYKFFPNKIELAKTIMDDLIDSSLERLNEIIHSNKSFSEKLKALFLMKLEGINNISMELIKDIHINQETGLKEHMDKLQAKAISLIVEFYKDSQKKGYIRKEIKIDFILAYSAQIIKLMEDENLLSQYEQPQDLVIESMNLLFYGIVTGNE